LEKKANRGGEIDRLFEVIYVKFVRKADFQQGLILQKLLFQKTELFVKLIVLIHRSDKNEDRHSRRRGYRVVLCREFI